MRHILTISATLLLASTSFAQGDYRFILDTNQSGFTWTGDTSLGPVIPDSTNQHTISGYSDITVSNGSWALETGDILLGNMIVTPDIHAWVSGPFGINLADIDITNISFSARSLNPFNLSPGAGSFTANMETTFLSGNLTVNPLTGDTINEDLTGTSSNHQATGNLYKTANGMHYTIPLSISVSALGVGVSGSFDLIGVLVGDFVAVPPSLYCSSAPNSASSFGAQIGYWGSTSVSSNDLTLIGSSIPTNQFGIFYYGPNAIEIPFGNGYRCVGGGVHRMNVMHSGATGSYQKDLDFTSPAPHGCPEVDPGETWRFQCWFRDPPGGGSTFNLTNAVSVDFIP
jgi:hypothetical protein